jgi:predicted DNA-binding transcriptional regulator AlpA
MRFPVPQKTILNTWKEIAQYVGRSVRTIQRWERELGFPIHRPRGKQRSAVLAMPPEIDEWARHTPSAGMPEHSDNVTVIDHDKWTPGQPSQPGENIVPEKPANGAQHRNSKVRAAQ